LSPAVNAESHGFIGVGIALIATWAMTPTSYPRSRYPPYDPVQRRQVDQVDGQGMSAQPCQGPGRDGLREDTGRLEAAQSSGYRWDVFAGAIENGSTTSP